VQNAIVILSFSVRSCRVAYNVCAFRELLLFQVGSFKEVFGEMPSWGIGLKYLRKHHALGNERHQTKTIVPSGQSAGRVV